MMKCPLCRFAAHTRSSQEITPQTKERYNQCTNINSWPHFYYDGDFYSLYRNSCECKYRARPYQRRQSEHIEYLAITTE